MKAAIRRSERVMTYQRDPHAYTADDAPPNRAERRRRAHMWRRLAAQGAYQFSRIPIAQPAISGGNGRALR